MDSSKWQCKYICKITEEELSWIAKIIVRFFKEILSNKASYYTFVFFLTYHVGMLKEYPDFLKDSWLTNVWILKPEKSGINKALIA